MKSSLALASNDVVTRYLRTLSAVERTPHANRQLAYVLVFVAGAVNAGGFLAVAQYTSHMSGIVSSMANHLALGSFIAVSQGMAGVVAFLGGAASAAMLINVARRNHLASQYALPLALEAALLLLSGLMGGIVEHGRWLYPAAAVAWLCFIMGLQNAIITKISRAEIRTTHITGLVTDIGIELGKLFYWNTEANEAPRVLADRQKLRMLGILVMLFFFGGVAGAFGFACAGFVTAVPLGFLLAIVAMMPLLDDVRRLGAIKR